MTTYYARAGGGNWDAAATWSLTSGGGATGSVPTAADDVILDANSGNVVINGVAATPSLCRSLDCTGYTGTLTMPNTTTRLIVGDGTAGAFKLVAGMTFAPNTSAFITFASTTTGNNITTAGKTLCRLVFNGAGGGWVLQDSLTVSSTGSVPYLELLAGTLDTNGQNVSSRFVTSGSATRGLTLGATTWTVPNSTQGWDVQSTTGFTYSGASAAIIMSSSTSISIFNGGGLTYNSLSSANVTTGTLTISGANTFTNLTLGGGQTTGRIALADNQTVTGTLTMNGTSLTSRALIRSDTTGTARTITAAAVTASYLDLQDITGAGAASWDLSAITGLSGDCGGNSGITFTSPANNYWVPASGTSTGNTNAVTRWASSSGGTAGTGRILLPQDTGYFDANSIDAGGRTITLGINRSGAVNFTGVTNSPTVSVQGTGSAAMYGDFIGHSSLTYSGASGTLTLAGRGAHTFDTGGISWIKPLTFDAGGGSYTLGNSLSSSANIILASGALNGASSFSLSCAAFSMQGGSFTPTANTTLSGTFSVSAGSFNSASYTVSGATTVTLSGGTVQILGLSSTGNFTASGSDIDIGTSDLAISGSITVNAGSLFVDGPVTGVTTYSHSGGDAEFYSLDCSSTASFTLGAMTVGAGGLNATTFTLSGSGTRTLNMGAGTWTLSGTGTVWNAGTVTNLTLNANTSTVHITNTSATAKTFSGGGMTYYDLHVDGASGNGTVTITGSNAFNDLDFEPYCAILLQNGSTQTVTTPMAWVGASGQNISVKGSSSNATISVASGIVACNYLTLQLLTGTGGATFYAGSNSTDNGNVIGWTFTDPPGGGSTIPVFMNQYRQRSL